MVHEGVRYGHAKELQPIAVRHTTCPWSLLAETRLVVKPLGAWWKKATTQRTHRLPPTSTLGNPMTNGHTAERANSAASATYAGRKHRARVYRANTELG
jgi:hypothetical protein